LDFWWGVELDEPPAGSDAGCGSQLAVLDFSGEGPRGESRPAVAW